MGITNAKLKEVVEALDRISLSNGNARLKWAVSLNLTYIEGAAKALEKIRTDLVKDEQKWIDHKNVLIQENCKKGEDGKPILLGPIYQFDDNLAFQAFLEQEQYSEFPEVLRAQQERAVTYTKLLEEVISIKDFPYVIKWDFVELDENGNMVGINGHQLFVLMSAGLLVGEPPWLEQDLSPKSEKSKPSQKKKKKK